MITINLNTIYLISIVVVACILGIIEALKEFKKWKDAYDKQERIAKFIEDFDNSMRYTENHNDIDEYIRKAILDD